MQNRIAQVQTILRRRYPYRTDIERWTEAFLENPDMRSFPEVFRNATRNAFADVDALLANVPAAEPFIWICLVAANTEGEADPDPHIRAWTANAARAAQLVEQGLDMVAVYRDPPVRLSAGSAALDEKRFDEAVAAYWLSPGSTNEGIRAAITSYVGGGAQRAQVRAAAIEECAALMRRWRDEAAEFNDDRCKQQANLCQNASVAISNLAAQPPAAPVEKPKGRDPCNYPECGCQTSPPCPKYAHAPIPPARSSAGSEAVDPVRGAFRNADAQDWEHLLSLLGYGGHGKFWRHVFEEVREHLLHIQPQPTQEDIAQALCGADGNGFLCYCTPTAREAYMIRADAVLALSRPKSQ
jgi:hypothetical protein